MNELPLTEEFREFARSNASPLAGGLLVTRVINPDADVAWIHAQIGALANACGTPASAAAVLACLREQGFAGSTSYYVTDNSSLEFVLRERSGIPISLALVVLGVAEACALPAHGVNFPQHFLVDIDGQLADPFRMALITPAQRDEWLAAQGVDAASAFPVASSVDIVLRMFNNLRLLAQQRGDHATAIDFAGYQLLVAPEPLPFHLERIDLWLAAGVPEMARHEIDLALALSTDAALSSALQKRRDELAGHAGRLH